MSDRAPYSRVYWSVMDDVKFDGIREDMRHVGSWTVLLLVADMAWPAPAFVPPTVPKASVRALSESGLIDVLSGGRFRVHGLDAERGRRSQTGRNAAEARWSADGMQTHTERNAKPMLDETSKAEQRLAETSTPGVRDGLVNLDREALDALEERTGHVASMAGDKQLNEYDRIVGDHGLVPVLAAFDAVSEGKRMSARQLVWGAVKVLEPFVNGRVRADEVVHEPKPFVPRKLEPWEEEFRKAVAVQNGGFDRVDATE